MPKRITQIANWLRLTLTVKNESDNTPVEAEIMLYGDVGDDWFDESGTYARQFDSAMKQIPDGTPVRVRIHSRGGNVWDSFSIATMIESRGNVTTQIDGLAASAASVIFNAGAKRVMPRHAMQMIHKTSSVAIGNDSDMERMRNALKAHDQNLSEFYASRTGKTAEACMALMVAETWMNGTQCLENGLCDELTDDEPVENKADLSRFRCVPKAMLNKTNAPPTAGAQPPIIMNREEMIALLKSWGITVANDATDAWLKDAVKNGPPQVEDESKPEPKAETPKENGEVAAAFKLVTSQLEQMKNELDSVRKDKTAEARKRIESIVDQCIVEDRGGIGANSRDDLVNLALKDEKILNIIQGLPQRTPGFPSVSNIEIKSDSVESIITGLSSARAPISAMLRGTDMRSRQGREAIGASAQRSSQIISQNSDKLLAMMGIKRIESNTGTTYTMSGTPMMNEPILNGTTSYGGVAVDSNLQRQVILTEAMRAFRRRLLALNIFSRVFQSVPLEGNDKIEVPYYPLFTTASSRLAANRTYTFGNTDQALSKEIQVGGVGSDAKTNGVDAAYQAMTWSNYLLRRQPWVDILKLVVMRVEQLALDVLNDIITAWVVKANYGKSVWGGVPTAFDETVVALLAGVARKSDWPEGMRNLALLTDYWVNLASQPYVKAFLNIGDTGVIRDGRIGGLYGFADTIENPRIPATADGNLVGFIAYPSALLVATAPIMPAPGELKVMVSYDIIVDDQTGLAFEYKYWGEPWNQADREIVQCNYGSGLGELAALKRITSTVE